MHERVVAPARPGFWTDEQQLGWLTEQLAPLQIPLPSNGDTVLDFGCGVGRVTKVLCSLGCQVYAVDISPKMIEYAKQYAGDSPTYCLTDGFGCGDVPDESCDLALSFITFQHMPTMAMVDACLMDLSRCLKHGATAVVQTMNRDRTGPDRESASFAGVAISKRDWDTKTEMSGLSVVARSYRSHWQTMQLVKVA